MNEDRKIPIQCVTLGHEKCYKLQSRRNNHWFTIKIVHIVYGRRIEE